MGLRPHAGVAEYIASDKPVAVTRHGQTVGIFIPTPGALQADLLALAQASAKLKAVMPLSEGKVNALVADFKAQRSAAPRRKRR